MSVSHAGSGASEGIEEGPPFRLLDLPRELRDRVYHYAYVPSSSDKIINQWNQKLGTQRKVLCEAKPSILLGPLHAASHQIHDELMEHLASLPNETVTLSFHLYEDFYMVGRVAIQYARCPKVTSVVFRAMGHNLESDWRDMFAYDAIVCCELLALINLYRTNGEKIQTVTFDHSAEDLCEWTSRVEMRNHSVLEYRGDIRITVNVRTLEIIELSGSLARLVKMELIGALEDFQELLLIDQPRKNASLWLTETELVQYEDDKGQPYLSYLNWLCSEVWKNEWPYANRDAPTWKLVRDEIRAQSVKYEDS